MTMHMECLIHGETPLVLISVRFLELVDPPGMGSRRGTLERRLETESLHLTSLSSQSLELTAGVAPERTGAPTSEAPPAPSVRLALSAERLTADLWKLCATAASIPVLGSGTADLGSMTPVHMLLACEGGFFVSPLEPEPEHAAYLARCKSTGTRSMVLGPDQDVMVVSPVVVDELSERGNDCHA